MLLLFGQEDKPLRFLESLCLSEDLEKQVVASEIGLTVPLDESRQLGQIGASQICLNEGIDTSNSGPKMAI